MSQPSRKTKIAFLIRSLACGGAERHLATLVKALDQEAFEVIVITFYGGGQFESDLLSHGIRVVCLRKLGRFEVIGFMRRLVMELQRLKPALLYSYLVEPNVVSVLLKLLFPKLRVIWSIQATDMRLHQHDWFVRLTFRLQCRLSRFADLIIATTAAGRAYHSSRGFHRSKFIVIENGVDTDDFRLDPESGQRMRSVWGIPDNLRLIGLVGRLDPIKGHPHFLKAAQLLTDHQDIRFVCVGNGDKEYESSLKKLSADYGIADRVIWAGSRNDMVAVYNALNISCSSSLSEGLPNAIVEAMACGVPCVVTDVGDSALIVGETGVVVPPGDPEALAKGIVDCLGKLTTSHQRQARERICERFSLGNFMRATEAVFQSLI